MAISKHLKQRIQTKAATFPAAAYREQFERKNLLGTDFSRDPKAEAVILQKWEFAFLYSKFVLKDRWPEFEQVLMSSPVTRSEIGQKAAFSYAKDVAGEGVDGVARQVSLNGELSAAYAISISREPWDESNPDHHRALNSIGSNSEAESLYRDGVAELSSAKFKRAG